MEKIQKYETRESWLLAALDALSSLFAQPLPPARVSVGWPGGRGKKSSVIGQCWKTTASADNIGAIFVSPVLDEPILILATLVHEMCHLADDVTNGHRKEFIRLAKSVGLEPKWTATTAGPELLALLIPIEESLGHYPHAKMAAPGTVGGDPVQGTRMLKVSCTQPHCDTFDPKKGEGYVARTTRKWLDAFGSPSCAGCGIEMDF